MPDQHLVVSHVITGAPVFLQRSGRLADGLLLVEHVIVIHFGYDCCELNVRKSTILDSTPYECYA